jgi:tetratricopeptide (TPR) repeat protein
MRASLERGELERMSDPSARLTYDPPPEAVADVLARRLSGMSDAAREILQIAAVVGREFDVDLLLALTTHSETEVMKALDEAEDGGVLACVDRKSGDWYRFSHVKIAQVLAQELNARSRRKLHAQIAAALRQREGTAPGEIAWHLYRAGDLERAAEAALQAARYALLIHDYDDALTFGVMAAEAAPTREAKRPAHELRGDALSRLERHGEAAAAYAHARLAGSADGPDQLSLRRKELRSALLAGSLSAAAGASEARRLVESAAGRPAGERAAMQVLLAEALLRTGDVAESLRAAETAEGLSLEDAQTRGEALLAKASALLKSRRPEEAEAAAGSAGEIFSATGDPNRGSRALMLRGAAASERGDRSAAAEILGSALKEAEHAQAARLLRQVKEMQAALGKDPGTPIPPPT